MTTDVGSRLATPDRAPIPPPVDIDSREIREAIVDAHDPLRERHGAPWDLHRHGRERVAADCAVVTGAEHETRVERVDLDTAIGVVANGSFGHAGQEEVVDRDIETFRRRLQLVERHRVLEVTMPLSSFHNGDPPATSFPEPVNAPSVEVNAPIAPSIVSRARCGSAGQITTSPATRRTTPSSRRTR